MYKKYAELAEFIWFTGAQWDATALLTFLTDAKYLSAVEKSAFSDIILSLPGHIHNC